jgi:hypothetical protein
MMNKAGSNAKIEERVPGKKSHGKKEQETFKELKNYQSRMGGELPGVE